MTEQNILDKLNNNKQTSAIVYNGWWKHIETKSDYYSLDAKDIYMHICGGDNIQ